MVAREVPERVHRQLKYEREDRQNLAENHIVVVASKRMDLLNQGLHLRREALALLRCEGLRAKVELLDAVLDTVDLPVTHRLVAHEATTMQHVGHAALLLFVGDIVEGVLANGKLAQHLFIRKAMVDRIHEAILGESITHMLDQIVRYLVKLIAGNKRQVKRV